jgi:putative DNA primase/helicase
MTVDPFAPISGDAQSNQGTKNRRCVVPVPETAPDAPAMHPKLGRPSKVWRYNDPQGNLLGFVCRFEEEGGAKSFLSTGMQNTGL